MADTNQNSKMTKEGEEEIETIQEATKEEIKMTQEGEESMEEEMIQEGEKATLKTKSLSSQLRHIRDICHEGIIRWCVSCLLSFFMGLGEHLN